MPPTPHEPAPPGEETLGRRAATLALVLLAGCGAAPKPLTDRGAALSEPLAHGGLAILTPTASFGREEDRQPLALSIAAEIAERRPELRLVPLAATLSAVNAAGLSERYGRMYALYRETGLFERDALRAVGMAVGCRYLMQVKLASFDQSRSPRFAYFGVTLLQSQAATTRLFIQIWDSIEGKIVWERSAEAVSRGLSVRERSIALPVAVRDAAGDLLSGLPA